MIIRVKGTISWRAQRDAETQAWVGVCDSLRLTAMGETWDELTSAIHEIQEDLFADLRREGELARFIRDHGWTPDDESAAAGATDEDVTLDVPTAVIPVEHAAA